MVLNQKISNVRNELPELPGFLLRRLTAEDMHDFIDLGLPTCAFMHGRPEMTEARMRQTFTTFVREHAFVEDSEIYVLVGPNQEHAAQLWLHTTRNRFNNRRELWIWDITVAERFRRQGLAKHLMEFSKQRAQALRSEELWLLVSSINDAAIQLYHESSLRSLGHLMCFPLSTPVREEKSITVRSAVLRPLADTDASALHQLWSASGLSFRPHGRDSLNRLRASLNGTHDPGWGAFTDQQLVGAALATYDGRKGWIERLAVHPQYRRAGLAKALVAACMNTLRDRGALVIAAIIDDTNQVSRRLFESAGFVHKQDFCYYTYRENNDS